MDNDSSDKQVIRRLSFMAVVPGNTNATIYLAILREVDGERFFPIWLNRPDFTPLFENVGLTRQNVLPMSMANMFKGLCHSFAIRIKEIRICAVRAGITYCHLICEQGNNLKTITFCNAAQALSLYVKMSCSITISETLLEKQQMNYQGERDFSMPLNALCDELLERALNEAIKKESYEEASRLRDELNKRK